MVVAEYSSDVPGLESLALQCLTNAPQFHIMFSHTVREKVYVFLMEDPFIYFAIFEEEFGRPQGFCFLQSVKDSFLKFVKSKSGRGKSNPMVNNLAPLCFQHDFSKVFCRLVLATTETVEVHSRSTSGGTLDSRSSGKKFVSVPLLGHSANKHSKKKKNENKLDVCDDDHLSREFSIALQKTGRHSAKKVWRRHVWIVLLIDFIVCCILFGIWLWICKGFKCIAG
ncbi:hypothetical protein GIB67_000578 [Kingdonia uniflora]|uniref:Longin domain-containing protein n=1 Tax=Kingdonia uniflora TaxID=39325 RepID=A0A7J7MIU0_9MAGN|nr:hypothetical protein GIB67_000578 [Kingdonia uniflora]